MEAGNRAIASQAIHWGGGVVCAGLSVAAATRGGTRGTRVASLALAGSFAVAIYGARKMVANAITEASRREEHKEILVDAQLGQALGGAHDALNSVEPELRALLRDPQFPPALASSIEEALHSIAVLSQLLRNSAQAREALTDENGLVPFVGISAAQQHKGGPRTVRPLYGSRDGLPKFVPSELRAAARQVGLVLDETRLLHTADVERAVLLFTLLSRAVLVSLSPLLGEWTPVRQPLAGGLQVADIPWVAASLTSIGTAIAGPWIVRMATEDSPEGRQFRSRLLLIEVPVCAATLFFSPSWTVVVFASGVTNWWQRQNKTMAFNWRKLSIFVAGVIALQGAGLAREHVPLVTSSLEVFGSLTAILITGASYGAMLPLTIGTAVDVLVGDGRRSLRAVITARGELVLAARQLRDTAEAIDVAAPDSDAARRAAATARRAALQIERAADRAGRRGLMSSHLLPGLAAEAIARSFLRRRDPTELERRQGQAQEAGEPAPPYATEPIFLSPELVHARITRQSHADALRTIIERSLNEAHIHGTRGVRVVVRREGSKLDVRIGNRPAPDNSVGISGQGGADLKRLVRRLVEGTLELGLRPADEVRMPDGEEWWVVKLTCSMSIFESSTDS
jgi:hypothetical protein